MAICLWLFGPPQTAFARRLVSTLARRAGSRSFSRRGRGRRAAVPPRGPPPRRSRRPILLGQYRCMRSHRSHAYESRPTVSSAAAASAWPREAKATAGRQCLKPPRVNRARRQDQPCWLTPHHGPIDRRGSSASDRPCAYRNSPTPLRRPTPTPPTGPGGFGPRPTPPTGPGGFGPRPTPPTGPGGFGPLLTMRLPPTH